MPFVARESINYAQRLKRAAILQSNYVPWKGYFDIINLVDEFVIYDDVQYTKNDWRNRNKIKTPDGIRWLTIPVFHTLKQRIIDTVTVDDAWRAKHWSAITRSYGKAPFFEAYEDQFASLYLGSNERSLSRINFLFLTAINQILGIKTRISCSTDYQLSGDRVFRLVELCKKVGAAEYVSGPSAKEYIKQDTFTEENIRIHWMDYSGYPEYKQMHPPFAHEVSILDLIFTLGPSACDYMKSFHQANLS